MKKAIVIGHGGIGQLYTRVLKKLKFDVTTVDKQPGLADYTDFNSNLGKFEIAVIATPNYTHESWARQLAPHADIVLVEKPGVFKADDWQRLVTDFENTNIMMVKNNQWRDNISELRYLAKISRFINVLWLNKHRIPNPGSHFTTRKLSFGGVSVDLMPHLLSLYCATSDYKDIDMFSSEAYQHNKLEDITHTDYGVINHQGTFDVDDSAIIKITKFHERGPCHRQDWLLQTDWANGQEDRQCIEFFHMKNTRRDIDIFKQPNPDKELVQTTIELGLCPEEAYQAMIEDALTHKNDRYWWFNQFKQDIWIHQQLEILCG